MLLQEKVLGRFFKFCLSSWTSQTKRDFYGKYQDLGLNGKRYYLFINLIFIFTLLTFSPQRWFVLTKEELIYYKDVSHVRINKPAGVIQLDRIEKALEAEFRETKKENCIMLITPLRTYYLHANSKYVYRTCVEYQMQCITCLFDNLVVLLSDER